eukprot:8404002-Prorocentrum_lima.AAC.1
MARVTPEDAPRHQHLGNLLTTLDHDPAFARVADWVGTLGGAHTGVYLLYGHPTCDWEWTLQNRQNKQRFQ